MQNVSAFGFVATLKASKTFPAGFSLTEFADDADPFDVPNLQIAETAMAPNGTLVGWSRANPLNLSISVLPGTDEAANLAVLFEANRPGKGKKLAYDSISIVVAYPDGRTVMFSPGMITEGPPSTAGVASAGRQKTMTYTFAFENVTSG